MAGEGYLDKTKGKNKVKKDRKQQENKRNIEREGVRKKEREREGGVKSRE